MDKNFEIRSYGGAPAVQGRVISGYAIVFNSFSEVRLSENRRFKEIILPTALTKQLLDRCDILMLLEHRNEKLLARSKQGRGTLAYSIDEKGVRYRFEAPKTADGRFAVEMIKRGDINGSSFAFNATGGDTWERKGGIWVRTIHSIKIVRDFSIVSDPAYTETTADVRNILQYESLTGWQNEINRLKSLL